VSERLNFISSELKRGMAIAKIVKPSSNDFTIKVEAENLVIFSSDKRRMSIARVPFSRDEATDGESNEYYVPYTRSSLFLSDGEAATITVDSDSIRVRVRGDGKSRQASFKRRSITSKRVHVPKVPGVPFKSINANSFSQLLKAVSCSAMVRQTKTEEEMRANQVHFYGSHAFSSTRYHASVATLDGMDLDLSIVSSDIPSIRSFCSRVTGDDVQLGQDGSRLYVVDPTTKSMLVISRVIAAKPTLPLLDQDGFKVEFRASRQDFQRSFNWASIAIEGTQRATMSVDSSSLRLLHGDEEIISIPVSKCTGSVRADFPVRMLATMAAYVESDTVVLRFMHKDVPTVLEMTGESQEIWRAHYVQSMKSR